MLLPLRKLEMFTYICRWVAGDWSTCSATCGQSTQTRRVECKKRLSTAKYINVYAMNCDRSSRPSTVRMCSKRDCYNWAESKWSTVTRSILVQDTFVETKMKHNSIHSVQLNVEQGTGQGQ